MCMSGGLLLEYSIAQNVPSSTKHIITVSNQRLAITHSILSNTSNEYSQLICLHTGLCIYLVRYTSID